MATKIAIWRERLTAIAGGTTHTQWADAVKREEAKHLDYIAVRNNTTDNADCLVGIYDGAYLHILYYFKNLTAGEWASIRRVIWLREGERLRFDWTGIVDGERLDIHLTGYREYYTIP